MKLDRRGLRRHLERLGQAPVPPASPDFAVRTEERLRAQGPVTAVNDELAEARARRRSWAPALVAAAAVTALLVASPESNDDVSLTTDEAAASSSTSLSPPPTLVAPTTTTTLAPSPDPAPLRPAVTTSTTLTPARPRPTTTSAPVRGSTTTTVVTAPPSSVVVTSATTVPAIARVGLRCVVRWSESQPFVTCTWADPPDTAIAGWRAHRATGDGAKRVIWTSADPSVRSFVDRDVVPGTTYQYAVEAFAEGGRIVAKGGIVTVACCAP